MLAFLRLALANSCLLDQFIMLSRMVFEKELSLQRPAIVSNERATSWTELRGIAESICRDHKPLAKRRVGLSFRPVAESYAILAALDKLACDVFLFDSRHSAQDISKLADQFRLGAILRARASELPAAMEVCEQPDEAPWSGESTVTVLTSGSTGEPKAARHTWNSLSLPVRRGAATIAPRWLLTYRPHLYAGLQVMLQCFANRGTLVMPDADMPPDALADFLVKEKVQFISATPSFWKRLLFSVKHEVLHKIPLLQITLGGEVVDQWLLDALKVKFSGARIVHIYATTELGTCFSVSDGRSGFPLRYLSAPSEEHAEIKIENGELHMRSPNAMKMYDPHSRLKINGTAWFPTGDLVEVFGDRVYFVGRKSDIINVGGSKVHPLEVERVIREVPGVSDVRVYGKNSSIVGQLIACEIVPSGGQDPGNLKESVHQACLSRLSSAQQPRLIHLVDRIELTAAGKTPRAMAL